MLKHRIEGVTHTQTENHVVKNFCKINFCIIKFWQVTID